MDQLTDSEAGKMTKTNTSAPPVPKPLQDTFRSISKNCGDKNVPNHKKKIVHLSTDVSENDNPYNLGVGSAVQYFEQYGVIKWIGTFSGDKKVYAKVEMVINNIICI